MQFEGTPTRTENKPCIAQYTKDGKRIKCPNGATSGSQYCARCQQALNK
jgi:hypothetical protein